MFLHFLAHFALLHGCALCNVSLYDSRRYAFHSVSETKRIHKMGKKEEEIEAETYIYMMNMMWQSCWASCWAIESVYTI